jgi:uncharacterized protein (DUF305 family)
MSRTLTLAALLLVAALPAACRTPAGRAGAGGSEAGAAAGGAGATAAGGAGGAAAGAAAAGAAADSGDISTPSSAPRIVQPGSPGTATREILAEDAVRPTVPHTEADVAFMQGMIPHHAQALAMTALVPGRTTRQDITLLARRIELSQVDEIKLMQEWLRARGEPVPEPDVEHTHHMGGDEPEFMPGMLTAEQMARLAAASGTEFDRLFIQAMIAHHQGALLMVHELFSTPGAAQGDEIHQFASHVEADQSIEIRRMRAMPR